MYRMTHGMMGFGLSLEDGQALLTDGEKAFEDPGAYAEQKATEVVKEKTGHDLTGGTTSAPTAPQPTPQASAPSSVQTTPAAPPRQVDKKRMSAALKSRLALARGGLIGQMYGRGAGQTPVPSSAAPAGAAVPPSGAPAMLSDQPPLYPPAEEKKPFPWMYVGIGAGVLALGVAAWFFTRPKKATPNRSKAKRNFRASKGDVGEIITIGKGKNRRRWGHRKAPKKHRTKGATKPSQFAWQRGFKYPIYDAVHVRAASAYYPRFKHRYPDYVRQEIAKNINAARKKLKISGPAVKPNRRRA